MNEKFLKVDDVMQILGISKSAAYNIMRQLNNELKEKGYAVIRGKIIEDKVTSEESIENDNKILNIQKYLAG